MDHASAPTPFLGEDCAGSPLRFVRRPQTWSRRFAIGPNTVLLARLHSRTRFTMMSWWGDQDEATHIVNELVTNAVEHVGPQHPAGEIVLDLAVDEDETLLIAVTDPSPEFPDFQEAISAQKNTGLALVRKLGGELGCFVSQDGTTKTVQALIEHRPPLLGNSH